MAGGIDGCHFVGGEFVGGKVGAAVLHPEEGAEIEDEVVLEKIAGVGEFFRKKTPEASSADFGSGAGHAIDAALGVLVGGFSDKGIEAHPVADGGDFSEGDSGLGHAVGAGIHAKEEDAFFVLSEFFEVCMIAVGGVVEGEVGVADWGGKMEIPQLIGEEVRCLDDF